MMISCGSSLVGLLLDMYEYIDGWARGTFLCYVFTISVIYGMWNELINTLI